MKDELATIERLLETATWELDAKVAKKEKLLAERQTWLAELKTWLA